MAWLERLKRPWKRPREETSGNLYLELCPDNRIKSFMVVRHRPKGTDSFMEFIGKTRKARSGEKPSKGAGKPKKGRK